jgi:hypothetical protein
MTMFLVCSPASTGHAQQQPAGRPAEQLSPAPPMLKITVVLSRVNGDKRLSNLPFVLLVTSREPATTVQMSSQVPIPTMIDGKSGFSYQSIGTSVRAQATPLEGGAFSISLNINDSQMLSETGGAAAGRMQSFSSDTKLVLKDGGAIQYNAATDKVTGDVVKVDVAMNVIK